MLLVWFYDPTSDRRAPSPLWRVDGPYCHCELQFVDGQAASIMMHSHACLRKRLTV